MFDHEKLRVYQETPGFASWAETILERAKKSGPLHDQLDRARTSIWLNIAVGQRTLHGGGSLLFLRHRSRIGAGMRGLPGFAGGEELDCFKRADGRQSNAGEDNFHDGRVDPE